ncbi:acyl-CoA dehydrogenase family protein [Gammaproteobacteria bacterium]|nr:acyl-CoA dehydrogenase family protein [Gammaproteobacteria bacterium]
MSLVLNEEQVFLKDSAKKFASEKTPTTHFREVRDSEIDNCYDDNIWHEMVSLGWTGILVPEEFGGSNFGVAGISSILEELGRTLTPSPLFSTAVVGVSLMKHASDDAKKDILTKVVQNGLRLCFAIEESNHHDPVKISCEAKKDGSNFIISGEKSFVIDGGFADKVIVACRTSGEKGSKEGLSLFVLDSDSKGLTITPTKMVDSRNAANMKFENVKVSSDMLIGKEDDAYEIIESVLDISRAAISAEMLGSALQAYEITLDYLKEREQFGSKIGSFQALQHRAAIMFSELELCKSCVIESITSFDEGGNDSERLASLSKAKVGEVFHLISNESVQMHGGIGVTDEYDIGLYLKRARVAEQIFGDSNFHKNRYAELTGY